jgi:hypothetical protein
MTRLAHDADISAVEVSNVSPHGFWLLLDGEELDIDLTVESIRHPERFPLVSEP